MLCNKCEKHEGTETIQGPQSLVAVLCKGCYDGAYVEARRLGEQFDKVFSKVLEIADKTQAESSVMLLTGVRLIQTSIQAIEMLEGEKAKRSALLIVGEELKSLFTSALPPKEEMLFGKMRPNERVH